MTFTRYESRPITRLAHRITEQDRINFTGEMGKLRLTPKHGEPVDFVHYGEVMTGDYVVYLNDQDVYHCSREVFIERNLVSEEEEALHAPA